MPYCRPSHVAVAAALLTSVTATMATFALIPSAALAARPEPQKADAKPGKPTLTSEEVAGKLAGVPVFLLVDGKGEPLVATPPSGGKPIVGIFMARSDATNFFENLKKRDKKTAEKVQVGSLSLADVYKASEKNRNVTFAFVPDRNQLESAKNMKGTDGKKIDNFDGTPLFVARTKGEGDAAGYLTMEQGGRTIIPFFFDKSSLDELVAKLFQTQPDVAKQLYLQAISLENVINLLRVSDSAQIDQVELIPLKASVAFVKSQEQGPVGPQQPAAPPKKGKKP